MTPLQIMMQAGLSQTTAELVLAVANLTQAVCEGQSIVASLQAENEALKNQLVAGTPPDAVQ